MNAKTYHQTDETTSDMPSWWTPERDAFLISLWKQGMTCSRIARELGAVSKNSIIGRSQRLNLPPRTVSVRKPPAPRKPTRAYREEVRKTVVARRVPVGRPRNNPLHVVELDDRPNPLKLLDPRVDGRGRCRWIEGEPAGVHTIFCAAPAVPSQSYCAVCLARTLPVRDLRPKAA